MNPQQIASPHVWTTAPASPDSPIASDSRDGVPAEPPLVAINPTPGFVRVANDFLDEKIEQNTPEALLLRVAERRSTVDDIRVMSEAARKCILSGLSLNFAWLLGIPQTLEKRRTAPRDLWLYRAAMHLVCDDGADRARVLEGKWLRFIAHGHYGRWKENGVAPADANALEIALFAATRHNLGKALSARHIRSVLEKFGE